MDAVNSGDNVVLSIDSDSLEYYKVTNEQKRCNLMGVTLTLRKMKYFHIEIHING